jgi:hypothetical protein
LQKGEGDDPKSVRLRAGSIYLIKERKPSLSYRLFERGVGTGLPGLCVTRQHPNRVKQMLEVPNTKLIWLSQTPGKGHHNPTDIGALATLISNFIEGNKKSVSLIDGLEYLVINNGFQQVLKFTELINEQVMQSDSLILIPISQNAFSDKELALLERNVETIEGTAAQPAADQVDPGEPID